MSIRFGIIVLALTSLVVVYVWQNIEVVKTKMEYRALYQKEKELIQENDMMRYEIEKLRTLKVIHEKTRDMADITPDKVRVIVVPKKKEKK